MVVGGRRGADVASAASSGDSSHGSGHGGSEAAEGGECRARVGCVCRGKGSTGATAAVGAGGKRTKPCGWSVDGVVDCRWGDSTSIITTSY